MLDSASQGIDVGDAVLSFLANTTQLDAAFQKIPGQAKAAMDAAADSVSKTGDATDQLASQMGAAGDSATKAGETISEGMKEGRTSLYEAKGEAALLGEMFGIHLPRHVRSFVAELPGIGTALSAAFAATAVLFLIEALVQGIEKLKEWAEQGEKIKLAFDAFQTSVNSSMRNLDDKLLESGARLDDLRGNHVAALRKELELIDHVSMKDLEAEFSLLAKAADAMFAQLKASWYEIGAGSQGAQHALEDFKAQYDLLLTEGKKQEASDLLKGTLDAAQKTQKALASAKKEAEDLNDLQAAGAESLNVQTGPSEKEIQAQDVLVRALQAQAEAEKKINELTQDQGRIKVHEEGAKAAEEETRAAKAALDQQLANIEIWKAAQHVAYEVGKTDAAAWRVAELQATDAAAVAHEDYLHRVVAIYQRAGEAQKAHEAQLQLEALETKNAATETEKLAEAMNKHREAAMRVREEYGHLVDAGVEKEFQKTAQAVQKLTAADEELQKAEARLAESQIADKYRDQEEAIRKLAQLRLITQEQMDDRLKLLEEKQANDALAILNSQLERQRALVEAAESNVAEKKASPFISAADVTEAEVNLKKLETAVVQTETQIVATKEKYAKQSESDDKSHYGRSLLLAMAYGKELLAEQLRENHAQLLAAQASLADAKAKGQETAAVEKQIAALKQHEAQLEKQANGNKQAIAAQQQLVKAQLLAAQSVLADAKARGLDTTAIEKQITELKKLDAELTQAPKKTKALAMSMDELKSSTTQAAQTMLHSFGQAMEGMLKGQEAFGAAMEKAVLSMIGQLAQHWADFYMAQAIGNLFMDPAASAQEFAAAAALEVLAAAAGALGSGGGSTNGGVSAGSPAPGQSGGNVVLGGGGGGSTVGVTHLAAGGVVSSPTMFMAGDSQSGGAADEAILPLSDPQAMRKIAQAILGGVLPFGQDNTQPPNWQRSTPRPFEYGQPSEPERPSFDYSGAPHSRDLPDPEVLAAKFGGLVSAPTLRVARGSEDADGAARFAAASALPGGFDQASLEKFADRITSHMSAALGATDKVSMTGGDHIHVNIKGMVSPDNAKKFIHQVNRMVQNRRVTLNASNSLRLTRRSQ